MGLIRLSSTRKSKPDLDMTAGKLTHVEQEKGEMTAFSSSREGDDSPLRETRQSSLPLALQQNLPSLYQQKVVPVDLSFDTVREERDEMTVHRAHKTIVRQQVAKASVCFVVKRPGCVLCKEQGQALTEMLAEFPKQDVGTWAVIKETGVDDEGLLELYQQYFNFPFFKDSKMNLYNAMGNRKVGIVPNPVKIATRYIEIRKRLKQKNIHGTIIGDGEGMVLGGVLIFDRKGNLQYAHQEQFSKELPIAEIKGALSEVLADEATRRNRRQSC